MAGAHFCEACNLNNPPDERECLKCGGPLGAAEEGPGSTVAAPRGRGHARQAFAHLDPLDPPLGDEGADPQSAAMESEESDRNTTVRWDRDAFLLTPPEHEEVTNPSQPRPHQLGAPTRSTFTPAAPPGAKAWLLCDPLPVVPLGIKPQTSLGRSQDSDMVLPHDSVSRLHAVILAEREKLVLEDRSSYGTLLNGERIRSVQLKPEDVIGIGPFAITLKEDRSLKKLNVGTRPLKRLFHSAEAMSGRLDRVSLAEVLQGIEFHKKTGTLTILVDGARGVLVVSDGRPMYATLGELKDAEALFQMLRMQEGRFSFLATVEAGDRTMGDTSITRLLMDYSRQVDEAQP